MCATRYTGLPASVLRHCWRRGRAYCVDIVFATDVYSRGALTCLTGLWSIICCVCEPGFCRLPNLFSPEYSYKMPLASKVETSQRIAQPRPHISIDHADISQALWVGLRMVLISVPWLLENSCTCQGYRNSSAADFRSARLSPCSRKIADANLSSFEIFGLLSQGLPKVIRKLKGAWSYSRVKLPLPHDRGWADQILRSSTYGIVFIQ